MIKISALRPFWRMRRVFKGVILRKRRQVMIDLALALVALIGGQTFFGTPVFGITNATISISISSSLSLGLSPGLFGSTSQTISVTTDNYTGYTATLTNPTNSTDLVNVSDNKK